LSPDGRRVWVANHLGNSVSVLDAVSGALVRTVDLGKASRVDPSIQGQYLFNNARMTRIHRFTCNSCHPDGTSDGLTWSFVHVRDGVDRRNTRDLRGGVAGTAPFRWSGFEAHLAEFVESEVTGLLGGEKPSPEEVKALAAALEALPAPPNPHRGPGGQLTPQAKRGEALFEGKAGCAACHAGSRRGGTGIKASVGTTPTGLDLDVPQLAGVFDSAPYLHDGRAATLEEVLERYNGQGRHGKVQNLTVEERAALVRFLKEL
jgi:YVTN family beta-propeller protein